jgi:hypothetical protein
MLCHVVIATLRKDLTDRVVSLQPTPDEARREGRRIMAAMPEKFVRCRVKAMGLTRSQVEAIVFEWGREEALEGGPPQAHTLPRPYAAAYRHGYRVGQQSRRRGDDA